jgi:hypothetical protein
MKMTMYVLFAVAALMLAGGRLSAHSVVLSNSHTASVMQAVDDEPSSDPAGDPDGPNGPDGGPDGEGEGGPGAV